MKTKFLLALSFLAGTLALVIAGEAPITQGELVRRTQELFDAVVSGNQTPWKKYYADDCIYSDEKGRTMDKAALVADIAPLPAGYSGAIKFGKVQSLIDGDTAILSYDLDESETIFGQELHARYHQTDTWRRRQNEWQIVASQAHRHYEDPAAGKADPQRFGLYLATYALGPERKTTVTAENGSLFMERTGGKKAELFSESGDLFFRKGVEGRILFHFGDDGRVDQMIDRRNNEDVIWRKVP